MRMSLLLPSLAVLALAPLALAGCGEKLSHADAAKDAEVAVKVETAIVSERPVAESVTLTGSLVAGRRSAVASDVNGKALATFVERGSFVQAGDPLVRLDSRLAALSQAEARAQMTAARTLSERAKADCKRGDDLFAQQAISRSDYDRMTAECRATAAQAQAATARESLAGKMMGDAMVRAPFAGIVDERNVTVGEYVRAGQPVATVIEIDPLRLELTVPETYVGAIREGQEVEFETNAFPGKTWKGTVKYISASMRRASRDLIIEAVVTNPERRLRPGMFAVARIVVGESPRPVIPKTAVRTDGDSPRVFIVREGRLEERLVQLGRPEADGLPIVAGLKQGERIVSRAGAELRDGLKVE